MRGISLCIPEQGCHLWKFYKAISNCFLKVKKSCLSIHQKLFVIYISGESIFLKVRLIASCFNHLCRQEKGGWWFGSNGLEDLNWDIKLAKIFLILLKKFLNFLGFKIT